MAALWLFFLFLPRPLFRQSAEIFFAKQHSHDEKGSGDACLGNSPPQCVVMHAQEGVKEPDARAYEPDSIESPSEVDHCSGMQSTPIRRMPESWWATTDEPASYVLVCVASKKKHRFAF